MQELRPAETNLRVLFAFDPRGRAVILIGGDKTNDWRGWYDRNVPRADRLFTQHLSKLGVQPWTRTRTSSRSSIQR
jgi:hypothetical protein